MEISQAFERFLKEITPAESEYNKAIQAHTLVRENLSKLPYVERFFLSGSYKRKTSIGPLNDVDIFVVVSKEIFEKQTRKKATPREILQVIEEECRVPYPNNEILAQSNSVGIKRKDPLCDIDVVPVVKAGRGYEICNRDKNKFVYTNPDQAQQNVTRRNQFMDGNFLEVVRMLKAWNSSCPGGKMLKSFHVELMATETSVHKKHTHSYQYLPMYFRALSKLIMEDLRLDLRSHPLPVNMHPEQRRNISAQLKEAARVADIALQMEEAGRTSTAFSQWKKIFKRFPTGI